MLPAAVRQLATAGDDKSDLERVPRGRGRFLRVSERSRGRQAAGKRGGARGPVPGKPAAGFGTFAGSGRTAGSHRRSSGPHPHPGCGAGAAGVGLRGRLRLGPRRRPLATPVWSPQRRPRRAEEDARLLRTARLPRPRCAQQPDPCPKVGESRRKGGAEAGEQGLGEVGPGPSLSASPQASLGAGVSPQSLPIRSLSSSGFGR